MIDNQKLNNDRIVYEQSSTVNDDDITSAMRMEPIYMALSKAISSDEYDGSDNGSNELG